MITMSRTRDWRGESGLPRAIHPGLARRGTRGGSGDRRQVIGHRDDPYVSSARSTREKVSCIRRTTRQELPHLPGPYNHHPCDIDFGAGRVELDKRTSMRFWQHPVVSCAPVYVPIRTSIRTPAFDTWHARRAYCPRCDECVGRMQR